MRWKNPLITILVWFLWFTVDPYFSTIRLSLLDRGFIYVLHMFVVVSI